MKPHFLILAIFISAGLVTSCTVGAGENTLQEAQAREAAQKSGTAQAQVGTTQPSPSQSATSQATTGGFRSNAASTAATTIAPVTP